MSSNSFHSSCYRSCYGKNWTSFNTHFADFKFMTETGPWKQSAELFRGNPFKALIVPCYLFLSASFYQIYRPKFTFFTRKNNQGAYSILKSTIKIRYCWLQYAVLTSHIVVWKNTTAGDSIVLKFNRTSYSVLFQKQWPRKRECAQRNGHG